jgi:hypothetical protein
MELREFIAETLDSIVKGIIDAKSRIGDDAIVNPVTTAVSGGSEVGSFGGYAGIAKKEDWKFSRVVHMVRFDVALTVESGAATTGGGKLNLKIVEVDMSGDGLHTEGSVSRVTFQVPMVLPGDTRNPSGKQPD